MGGTKPDAGPPRNPARPRSATLPSRENSVPGNSRSASRAIFSVPPREPSRLSDAGELLGVADQTLLGARPLGEPAGELGAGRSDISVAWREGGVARATVGRPRAVSTRTCCQSTLAGSGAGPSAAWWACWRYLRPSSRQSGGPARRPVRGGADIAQGDGGSCRAFLERAGCVTEGQERCSSRLRHRDRFRPWRIRFHRGVRRDPPGPAERYTGLDGPHRGMSCRNFAAS